MLGYILATNRIDYGFTVSQPEGMKANWITCLNMDQRFLKFDFWLAWKHFNEV